MDRLMSFSVGGGRTREIQVTYDGTVLTTQQLRSPVFSPDGSRIAFSANYSADDVGRDCWVFTITANGEDLRCVTKRLHNLSERLWWAPSTAGS